MACAVDESARKFAVAPRDVEDAVPYNARPAALAGSPLSACPVPFYPVRYKNRTGSFGRAGPVFMAIPHNSTRAFGERFFADTRFEKCRNTLCTRKGHAASVRRQGRRCGGLFNAKGNPDGFLSHYPSLRDFRSGRFFDSLRRPPGITGWGPFSPSRRLAHCAENRYNGRHRQERKSITSWQFRF